MPRGNTAPKWHVHNRLYSMQRPNVYSLILLVLIQADTMLSMLYIYFRFDETGDARLWSASSTGKIEKHDLTRRVCEKARFFPFPWFSSLWACLWVTNIEAQATHLAEGGTDDAINTLKQQMQSSFELFANTHTPVLVRGTYANTCTMLWCCVLIPFLDTYFERRTTLISVFLVSRPRLVYDHTNTMSHESSSCGRHEECLSNRQNMSCTVTLPPLF